MTPGRAALLLRRSHPPAREDRIVAEARELAAAVKGPVRLQACVSLDGALAYLYAWTAPAALNGAAGEQLNRLAPIGEWRGASAGTAAPYHYVVATDVEPGWEAEFNDWYQAEHMPGLAAVPGSVHCARLRSVDARPHYHACYDLVSPRVMERREWLAVRHTAWASRVRPHFRNTRRIMFRTLLDER